MVTNQAYLFFIFILNGIIIGILFDFFRILRKTFKTTDFVTYIEDLLFWILTGFSIIYFIFAFNNGEIRLFMFLGIALGIFIYMFLFSSYFIKINVIIINFFKKIIGKIFKIIFIPIKFIKKIFFKPISFIFINIRKTFANLYNKIINITKNNKKQENNVKN